MSSNVALEKTNKMKTVARKKIPELMKGLGKGVKNFKDGLNDVTEEINKTDDKKSTDEEKK